MKTISFRNDILPLKDRLYRLALRITLDAAEAEDVVQDTLIRVWDKRDEWAHISSAEAYCLTVCRNLALDRNARSGRQNEESLDENIHTAPNLSSAPDEEFIEKERLGIVRALLDKLPEVQRTIMELREVEGKSYKEIAAVLALSEEQVKVYLFRARQRIRQAYTKIEKYGL